MWGASLFENLDDDRRLIVIAVLAGAVGSLIHAIQSFAKYLGARRLTRSWIGWYLLRPMIGMLLALLVYFLIRAGLLPMDSANISPYGTAAVAALAGMFSKQATDKLAELFDSLFLRAKPEKLEGSLEGDDKQQGP